MRSDLPYTHLARRPGRKAQAKLLRLFREAKHQKNEARMCELLDVRHLDTWWQCYRNAPHPRLQQEALDAVGFILEQTGIVSPQPERRSERIMREATQAGAIPKPTPRKPKPKLP